MRFMIIIMFILPITVKANLSESACATMVVNELKTVNPSLNEAQAIAMWTKVCKGILDHIKASAQVGPFPAGTLKDSLNNPVTGSTGTATGVIQ